jgi:hypothetical protein
MTSAHKLFIVEAEDWIVRVQKVGVENDLDPVVRGIEQLDPAELVQNRVGRVVNHVVCDDRRERVALEGEDAALEENLVLFGEDIFR